MAPQKNDLLDKLKDAAEKLLTLHVATIVGQAEVKLDATGKVMSVTTPEGPVDAIVTILDLVGGDVTTHIAPDLKNDSDLRAFHEALVGPAAAVLPNNLKALADAVRSVFG